MYVLLEMWMGMPVACVLTVEWSIYLMRVLFQYLDQAEMKSNAKKATEKEGAKAPPATHARISGVPNFFDFSFIYYVVVVRYDRIKEKEQLILT